MSVLQMADGQTTRKLTIAFAGRLVQRKLTSRLRERNSCARSVEFQRQTARLPEQAVARVRLPPLGSRLLLGAGFTFRRLWPPADAQTIHHRPSTSHASLVTHSLCRFLVKRSFYITSSTVPRVAWALSAV
jgi:hypothetical protein